MRLAWPLLVATIAATALAGCDGRRPVGPRQHWQQQRAELQRAVADDPELAARLGTNAKQIQQRLDETLVAAEWRRYLETIVD